MKIKILKISGLALLIFGLVALFLPIRNFSGTIVALGLILLGFGFFMPFGRRESLLVKRNVLIRLSSNTPEKDGAIEFYSDIIPRAGKIFQIDQSSKLVWRWEGSPEESNPVDLFVGKPLPVTKVKRENNIFIVSVSG